MSAPLAPDLPGGCNSRVQFVLREVNRKIDSVFAELNDRLASERSASDPSSNVVYAEANSVLVHQLSDGEVARAPAAQHIKKEACIDADASFFTRLAQIMERDYGCYSEWNQLWAESTEPCNVSALPLYGILWQDWGLSLSEQQSLATSLSPAIPGEQQSQATSLSPATSVSLKQQWRIRFHHHQRINADRDEARGRATLQQINEAIHAHEKPGSLTGRNRGKIGSESPGGVALLPTLSSRAH